MIIYNDAKILYLIEQIREVNHLFELHKLSNDNFMSNQYTARKNDFLKELVFELICIDINTNEVYQVVKKLIIQIEKNTPKMETHSISKYLHFSI